MKLINSAKSILILTLALIVTGCASNFDKYRETTSYNLMQCQKMCSTGNVAQIEKFGCACNFNRPGNSSNQNKNYSSSNGNVIYMNTGSQNSGSNQFWGAIAGQLMQHEENRLNRLNRDLNSPNPNVAPQYNNYNYNVTPNNGRVPTNFGGFGGF